MAITLTRQTFPVALLVLTAACTAGSNTDGEDTDVAGDTDTVTADTDDTQDTPGDSDVTPTTCATFPDWVDATNLDRIDPKYVSTAFLDVDLTTTVDLTKYVGVVPVDDNYLRGTNYPGAVDPTQASDWLDESWIRWGAEGSVTGGSSGCASPTDASPTVVSGAIDGTTSWSCDHVVELSGVVTLSAELTVAPGTIVRGGAGSALVVVDGGRLIANGTVDAPIVFTSNDTVSPAAGDWAGLVFLGRGQVNVEGGVGTFDAVDGAPLYGGGDDSYDCGIVRYVRVEYAGGTLGASPVPALNAYGCGKNSRFDSVEVLHSGSDGVWFAGGHTNIARVVVAGAPGVGVHLGEGYDGDSQFWFVQQAAGAGTVGFQVSNNADNANANPRTRPRLANVTVLGSGAAGSVAFDLVHGAAGLFYNFALLGADVGVAADADVIPSIGLSDLVLQGTLFWDDTTTAACE